LRVALTGGGVTQSLVARTGFVGSASKSDIVILALTSDVVATNVWLAKIVILVLSANVFGVVE
jgi:hypothetical protein